MNNLIKIFSLLLPAMCTVSRANAQEITDTIKVIDKVNEVMVEKNGDKTIITANYGDSISGMHYYIYEVEVSRPDSASMQRELPDSWEIDLPFVNAGDSKQPGKRSRKLRRAVTGFDHVYWGWRFNYADRQQVKNCFEVGVLNLIGATWSHGRYTPSFTIGVGFGMMRFLAQDGYVYGKNGDAVTFLQVSPEMDVDKSRLDVWRFHVPVMLTVPVGRHGSFYVGGVANFNTYASAVTRLQERKHISQTKYKGLQQKLFTADIYASFTIGGIGLYASWSPMPLFGKDYGPQLKSWSIGIDLTHF